MKKLLMLLLIILSSDILSGQIINIPGDYPTIQQGINASSNGDTVLVQPGTYIENINYNGKNITVASLYLIARDTSYISQTIINGGQDGTVVMFESGEDSTAVLIGFTITNGFSNSGGGIRCYSSGPTIKNSIVENNSVSGNPQGGGGGICCYTWEDTTYWVRIEDVVVRNNTAGGTFGGTGGGINCKNMSLEIINVKIQNNSTSHIGGNWSKGGGIYIESPSNGHFDTIFLRDCTISGNETHGNGGGIYLNDLSDTSSSISLIFDSINRCNINSNKGALGADLYTNKFLNVILNTFTVMNPTDYHAEPLYNYSFDIQNSKLQQVNSSLFVSPDGDNSNSGLTSDDPLRTIDYALSILRVDSLHPQTLNLLEGFYDDQFYPINIPDFLNFVGVSDSLVILDAGNRERVMTIINNKSNLITGICLQRGHGNPQGGGIYCIHSDPLIQDVTIRNNYAYGPAGGWGGGLYFENSSPSIVDALVEDNTSTRGGGLYYRTFGNDYWTSKLLLLNVVIKNNNSGVEGGGIYFSGSNSEFQNVLIVGNTSTFGGGGMYCHATNSTFKNLTISENISSGGQQQEGGGIYYGGRSNSIFNSIIYGNMPDQIEFMEDSPYPGQPDTLQISFSNIQHGLDSIGTLLNDTVFWLEGNIDLNPQFIGTGTDPYSLDTDSPCIDSGIPDTSGLNLPNADIILNMRIWDGDYNGTEVIDMGAYEFGSIPVLIEEPVVNENDDIDELTVFPNPFCQLTSVRFKVYEKSYITISIYNQVGERVDTMFIGEKYKGLYEITWAPTNLSSGIYFIKLQTNRQTKVHRIIKI